MLHEDLARRLSIEEPFVIVMPRSSGSAGPAVANAVKQIQARLFVRTRSQGGQRKNIGNTG